MEMKEEVILCPFTFIMNGITEPLESEVGSVITPDTTEKKSWLIHQKNKKLNHNNNCFSLISAIRTEDILIFSFIMF